MPATLDDIFPCIRPLWTLEQRLLFHMGVGQMLSGLHYDPFGKVEVKGKSKLPLLQPVGVIEREDVSIGGASSPQPRGSGTKADIYEARYLLQTSVDNGLFRSDPTAGTRMNRPGLCEWTCLIRDAMETKSDGSGVVDTELGGMVVRPLQFEVEDSGYEQVAWSAVIKVTLTTRLYFPGMRSCLRPTES